MENNNTGNSVGMCEKIFNAVCVRSKHRVSHPPQDPAAADTGPNHSLAAALEQDGAAEHSQHGAATTKVAPRIEPAHHIAAPHHVSAQENSKPKAEAASEAHQAKGEEGKKSGAENINDKFTDYIHRAKLKMRAISNVGRGKSPPAAGKDHVNDKFTDYINRAKIKIRTTSNVGAGKSVCHK